MRNAPLISIFFSAKRLAVTSFKDMSHFFSCQTFLRDAQSRERSQGELINLCREPFEMQKTDFSKGLVRVSVLLLS